MAKIFSGIGSIDLGTATSNASAVLDCVSGVASVLATPTYDNEVNHRPAVQQWTVRTP